MILDVHVHVSAVGPTRGRMSPQLLASVPFRFMRWKFGLRARSEADDIHVEELLVRTVENSTLDAAVVLAFDAAYTRDGQFDEPGTHLYVTNDYALDLSRRHPKLLFAGSVHPYRKDAVAELERCIAAGAVLIKWLPVVQNFNPADPICIPFYEALAHHGIPLLCHTGSEHALPNLDPATADPMLLMEAIRRGVTVIAAHCGTRVAPWEIDFFPNWQRLARDHEHFYGDTAALNVPGRGYAIDPILRDPVLRSKVIHGSDWPIPATPPLRLGVSKCAHLLREKSWLQRDILIKQELGFDDAYWRRAATLLRILNQKYIAPLPSPTL